MELRNVSRCICKAELRQSFSPCVYCMLWRFQSNYAGLANQGNYFKTQPYTVNAHWKRLSPLSFSHSQSIESFYFNLLEYFKQMAREVYILVKNTAYPPCPLPILTPNTPVARPAHSNLSTQLCRHSWKLTVTNDKNISVQKVEIILTFALLTYSFVISLRTSETDL